MIEYLLPGGGEVLKIPLLILSIVITPLVQNYKL